MSTEALAIFEDGVLRLLTPISLPDQSRVRLSILSEEDPEEALHRAETALIDAGLVKPAHPQQRIRSISQERRAELAHLYAKGSPLSEIIIEERNGR
ncbi:MAG: DUF104 domain-containing protein [Anaerolineales bacterium]|nr:DUF104 domain-containing protein [Anaerolineales bacterium]